jgi:hypothetical protein
MAPVSAVFLAVPFVSGGGVADNFVRAADGAGGRGRFIPPGGGGGFTPPGGSGGGGDDLLEKFVQERVGTNPQNISCYGCVFKEWPEAQGHPAIIDNLTPNPWGDNTIANHYDFAQKISEGTYNPEFDDLIEVTLRSNFNEIDFNALKRGDIISWHKSGPANFGFGRGIQRFEYTQHVGIYLGNGQVFSKMGLFGAYEILSLDSPNLMRYGSTRYWR